MKTRYFTFILLVYFLVCRLVAGDTTDAREPLYHESLRPQFHFTARYWENYRFNPPNHEEGWINDLNGLMYNDGVYHLFAQRWWSAWLHAVSADLIHWKELKPAFGKGGQFGGTQSGGGVVDRNNTSGLGDGITAPMLVFWSSTDNLNQCMSYSLDKGQTWKKYEKNPVLVHAYRDPNVFWYEPDKKWILVLYGPSDDIQREATYGFNGESNDAHDLMPFTPGEWIDSALRLYGNGNVVVTDRHGQRQAAIDIGKENLGKDGFYVGAKSNQSEYFEGDMAELLVYDRPLSDEETKSALGSLRSKWGLDASLQNSPIPTEGLVLHLDAAESVDSRDGLVSAWKDISGHEFHLSTSNSDEMPKQIENGLGNRPVIRFEGKQCLRGPAVLAEGAKTFTIVALWKRNSDNGSQVICEQNASTLQTGRRASLLTVCRNEPKNVYLLFSSPNLLDWTKLDTAIPDSFECPDMFPLPVDGNAEDVKWVVVDGSGDYRMGSFDGKKYVQETTKQKGDYGRNFYATMTFDDMPSSDPRRIQLAWMRGWDDYPKNMPFNQQISFPCELTLHRLPEGIVLRRYPVREISTIYDKTVSLENLTLQPVDNPLASLQGELFDIEATFDVQHSRCSRIEFNLCGNTVAYDLSERVLESVGSKAPLAPRDGKIEIRILIDRLSLETFGNQGEVSITNIAYQKDTAPRLSLHAVNGEANVISLTVHTLKSIWE